MNQPTFCRPHSSYFCPCVRPDLYTSKADAEKAKAWEAALATPKPTSTDSPL